MSTVATTTTPLPLKGWSHELARAWNSNSYTVFVLQGNIFDVFPLQTDGPVTYVSLKAFLAQRMFPQLSHLLFYDIADGLSFGTPAMQKAFFEWLELYDQVEGSALHVSGPPCEFNKLVPLLHRFFIAAAEQKSYRGLALIIDFPEKIVPAAEEAGLSVDERVALVSLLKWASSPEFRRLDIGVLLVTESAAELHADLLQNPHVAQIALPLPDGDERQQFLTTGGAARGADDKQLAAASDLALDALAARTAGLNLLRIQHLIADAVHNDSRITSEYVAQSKKRLIEEYCQGLVKFKEPKPGLNLDAVATHTAAKKKFRELAQLIKANRGDVLERGVLLPGRVGVGKSFLIDCFASECGLPVMEMGDFRSKWVGDTERQLSKILLTIKALGPVIVIVDEADAVFGNRASDGDSGVSTRVFAAFAAHIGDASLRGRELWIAMTSRPDLLAIDMKRQGRFGLCIPLFPAQNEDEVRDLFTVIAHSKGVIFTDDMRAFVREKLGAAPLTGSEVEAMLLRAKEQAALDNRTEVRLADLQEAVASFVDPLDPTLIAMQDLAAVLACSDNRFLPARYRDVERATLTGTFALLKAKLT
ncbi:MAG: AAA family ATPase [bacterium]|nr:AAA family ATPase [bacterium]